MREGRLTACAAPALAQLCPPSVTRVECVGGAQVPATQLASGVYRCYVPPHEAGTVGMCVSYGDGRPRSNAARFTYRVTPQTARAQDDLCAPLPPPFCIVWVQWLLLRPYKTVVVLQHCANGLAASKGV